MSKIDEIRGEMVKAMKAKDKARKDVLSLLLAELKNVEINNRTPLTDEEGPYITACSHNNYAPQARIRCLSAGLNKFSPL